MITKVKYPRVGCGALIVNDKKEILLLKRAVKDRDEYNYWGQPGGGVEFGEKVEWAIKREIKEELGIEIELIKLLCYTDYRYPEGTEHWVAISYLAKIKKGIPKNMEPDKHSEIGWFPINKLPSKLTKATRDSTKAYLSSSF